MDSNRTLRNQILGEALSELSWIDAATLVRVLLDCDRGDADLLSCCVLKGVLTTQEADQWRHHWEAAWSLYADDRDACLRFLVSLGRELRRNPKVANRLPEETLGGEASLCSTPGIDETLEQRADPANAKLASEPEEAYLGSPARFRKLEFLAKGNLGEVYIAEDRELNRRVAIKEIAPRLAQQAEACRRFLVEGEITGRLEHPGIVSVYGMGLADDGRPYYAMRLIEGITLQEELERFHGDRQESTSLAGPRAVAFRSLLTRFLQICEAIDYAHSRGVIHRDIKPSNLMLGEFGEALVVDWGLAKSLASPEEETSGPSESVLDLKESEGTGANRSNSGSGTRAGAGSRGESGARVVPKLAGSSATMDGSRIGTPAYMSPEQAAGENDRVGVRSDVYALGATLYQILTGHPPIEEVELQGMLVAICLGKIRPPRQHWRAIPKPLEAICIKALSLKPEDRFASAGALAEELQRFLADEPLTCWQGNWTDRLGRWVRHHQTFSSSIAVAALVSIIVLAGAFRWVDALREEAESKARLARIAEADANRSALDAAQAQSETLDALDQSRQQQKRAERTAEFLAGIFQTADPVGINGLPFFIPKRSGERPTIDLVLEEGRRKLETSLADDPLTRAAILTAIGNAERAMGRLEQARVSLDTALQLRREGLGADAPEIAEGAHNLAITLLEMGYYDRAEPLFREALEIRRKVDGVDHPATASIEFGLAWLLGQKGAPREAESLMEHVVSVRARGQDSRQLAYAQIGVAMLRIEMGEGEQAAMPLLMAQWNLTRQEGNRDVERAVTEFCWAEVKEAVSETIGPVAGDLGVGEHLEEAFSSVQQALGDKHIYTGFGHYLLGEYYAEHRRTGEAMRHFESCWEIAREQVALRHPRILFLVNTHGELLTRVGRRAEAHLRWSAFLDAIDEAFGESSPITAEIWYYYAEFCRRLTSTSKAKSPSESSTMDDAYRLAAARFAASDWETLTESQRFAMEDAHYRAALAEIRRGDREAAEPLFARAQEIRSRLVSEVDLDLIYIISERAANLTRMGKAAEGAALIAEHRDAILAIKSGNRRSRREAWWRLHEMDAENAQVCGDLERRDARLADLERLAGTDGERTYELAIVLGRLASRSDQVDSESSRVLETKMFQTLRLAIERGFRDLKRIQASQTLAPWRESAQMRELVAMLEAK